MASKKTPQINASSQADIAFLLLVFFLITTTMDVDKGLQRKLPPIQDTPQQERVDVNRRNVIAVKINHRDNIMVRGQIVDISQIKDKIVEGITNPSNDPNLPDKEMKDIKGFGKYAVSRAVVSLQNDKGTLYSSYIAVQNEIVRGFNEVRDAFSMQNFGKKYARLDESRQKIVRDAIPQNISEAEPKDVSKGKK